MHTPEALEHAGREAAGSLLDDLSEMERIDALGVLALWCHAEPALSWALTHELLLVDSSGVLHEHSCSRAVVEPDEDGEVWEVELSTTPLAALHAGFELRHCCHLGASTLRGWAGPRFADARSVAVLTELASEAPALTPTALSAQLRTLHTEAAPLGGSEVVVESWVRARRVVAEGCRRQGEHAALTAGGCLAQSETAVPPRDDRESTHCALVVVESPPQSIQALAVSLAGEVVCERAGHLAVALDESARSLALPGGSVRAPRDLDTQRVALALEILSAEAGGATPALSSTRVRRALASAGEALTT